MGFLLSGLWHLASLLDWTSVVSPGLGVLARWYTGPLSGLTRLLARAWDAAAAADSSREPAKRSVVVMLTQNIGGRLAVRSAYLLFYGVTGAVVLAVKLVAKGACLGFCLVRAGLAHLTGAAASAEDSSSAEGSINLATSQLVPPPAVCSSLDALDRSAADSLAGADVSLLLSSAFCRVPDTVPPADLADTEFVCVSVDDGAAADFEHSLRADLPSSAPLVDVAADRARAFVCTAQDAPSAPSGAPSGSSTPSLNEFLTECREQPVPEVPTEQSHQERDVDLVTEMCPSLASSQVVPGTSNNSLLSGWVMLPKDQK